MYRTACKLPRRSVFTAAFAGAAVGLHEPTNSKLSIYPAPSTDIVLVDTPSELERQIGNVRRRGQSLYSDAHAHVQGWVSKWIDIEHAVENRIKSIIAPDESLTPGVLYVGVATLSGSILARNRGLPTRFLLPPLFLVFSANYFLPKATHNLSDYLGSLEDEFIPTFAQKHETAKAHSAMTWARVKDGTQGIKGHVETATSTVIAKLAEMSGLKLREMLEKQRSAKRELDGLTADAIKKAQESSKTAEEKTKES